MKISGLSYLLCGARRAQCHRLPFAIASLVLFFAGVLLLSEAHSAPIYSEDFDDGNASTRWTTVTVASASSNFAFDYTSTLDYAGNPIGVPQAGQTTHTGLKLAANTGSTPGGPGVIAGINAYASGLNLTTSVVMTFDMYAHFNDTGYGSTNYGTYGFYHSTQTGTFTSIGPAATSGYWFTNSNDNGTTRAVREIEVNTEDTTVARYLDGSQNPAAGTSVTYQSLFPDLDGAGGNSLAGFILNRWVNVRLTRNMATGLVKWEMKKPTDSSYTQIYSVLDATQTQNSGTITLGMTDPFSTVSGPNTFFLYDNVVVNGIPEPASLALVGIAIGSFLSVRRRSGC
jgi:hypothetical protein